MRSDRPFRATLLAIAALLTAAGDEEEAPLGMSPAVACRAVTGYEDYEPLPDATLTAEEKLVVYYRPLGYRVGREGELYRVHLTQDGEIRRRGTKAVLSQKKKLLDYEFTSKSPPLPIYLQNLISLKGLKPGEYDLDIILHDEIAKGPPARQSLPFKVVAPDSPEEK